MAGDDLYYGWLSPSPNTAKDCTNVGLVQVLLGSGGDDEGGDTGSTGAGNGGIRSIHVLNNYDGKITLSASQTLVDFELMAPARISQPGYGNDPTNITVTGKFNWTDGTLNSSDHPATVTVLGATADISPANQGTVTTGDTLVFMAAQAVGGAITASTGTFSPGTVAFKGGDGMVVGDACFVNLFPAPATTKGEIWLSLVGANKEEKRIMIQQGGTVKATTDRHGDYTALGVIQSDLPILNNGGVLKVEKKTHVTVKGNAAPQVPGQNPFASYHQQSGVTSIEDVSTLRGENGIAFNSGRLETRRLIPNSHIVPVPATLDGGVAAVTNGGATVVIHADTQKTSSLDRGVLSILGPGYNWVKGDYQPAIYGDRPGLCDRIEVFGRVVVGADAKVTPHIGNRPTVPATVVGELWPILTSGDKITGAVPVLPAPDQWELVPADIPVKRWDLKGLKDV